MSPGALLKHLLHQAVLSLELESDPLDQDQAIYLPLPLWRRMMQIVQDRYPAICREVTISFDHGASSLRLRIPTGLDWDEDRTLIRFVCKSLHALVLNHGMSLGFRACDIALEGGEPLDGPWLDEIRRVYNDCGFEVLSDRFLRDYNTERATIRILNEPQVVELESIPTDEITPELARYSRARGEATSLWVGIDIGGTLTKFQFFIFQYNNDQIEKWDGVFHPIGDTFRIQTPNGPAGTITPREFARKLVSTLIWAAGTDGLREEIGELRLFGIGITWPGSVRNNHVAGGSRIMERFGSRQKPIWEITIEDILNLDIIGELSLAYKAVMQARRGPRGGSSSEQPELAKVIDRLESGPAAARLPFVALVNDGVAEGTGAVVDLSKRMGTNFKGRLIVVKVGTGLAGAMFQDGRLIDGPCEWGKLLLDLAAERVQDPPFPPGVAHRCLSNGTMPTLFKKRKPSQFLGELDDLDSQELGLLLALPPDFQRDDLQPLRKECGLRHFSKTRTTPRRIDVAVLRRIHDRGQATERDLLRMIELQLLAVGRDAVDRFKSEIALHGLFRLEQLLEIDGETLAESFSGEIAPTARRAIEQVRTVAHRCALSMGNYLGDLLVLLDDLFDSTIANFIVGGGVLSDETGAIVVRRAKERAHVFGLELEGEGLLLKVHHSGARSESFSEAQPRTRPESADDQNANAATRSRSPSPTGPTNVPHPPPELDHATLGAVAHAAGELMNHERQRGINRIKRQLHSLLPNETARLDQQAIRIGRFPEIQLACFALKRKEVVEYLAIHGSELQLFQCGPTDAEVVEYRRWGVG